MTYEQPTDAIRFEGGKWQRLWKIMIWDAPETEQVRFEEWRDLPPTFDVRDFVKSLVNH